MKLWIRRLIQFERRQSREWLILALVGVFLIGLGWFIERRIESFISSRLDQSLAKATKKFGIPIQIGTKELRRASLLLTDIAIGEGQPIIVDKIEVGLGWNPFSPGFLRPSRIDISRIFVKEQVKRPDRLAWVMKWKDILTKRKDDASISASSSSLIPPEIHLETAKIILADGKDEHTLITGFSATIQVPQKKIYWEADQVVLKPRIEEEHLAGKVQLGEAGELQWTMKQRSELLRKPEWVANCEKQKNISEIVCDIDALHIPASAARPLAKLLSPSAERPGFHGSVKVSPLKNEQWMIAVDGDVTGIYAAHKAISIDQVGPFSLGSKFSLIVDRKAKRIWGKEMKFGISPDTTNERSVGFEVDADINKDTGDVNIPVSGDVHLTLPRTRCDDVLNAVPPGFAPDIQGFSLSGDIALDAFVHLSDGNVDFRWGKTMMGCQVAKVPQAYTSEYLSGAFELERTMSDGQVVRIPVDAARPDYAKLKDIPPVVVSAFITSEDAGFWAHHGVEPAAIVQAMERNAKEGRAAVGGSTITMQTVKNLFLSRDKNISRKAQEIFLAWHLEQALGKERILEIYLNIVEFGPGLYGIGAASRKFFGISVERLSLKQGIYLASLLPAPIPRFQYFCRGALTANYQRLVGTLLQRMLSLGRISADAFANANAEPIQFQRDQDDVHCHKNQTAPADETPDTDEKDLHKTIDD